MSGRLENKNIIVTAAGQGIGKATAIAFHNEGANVTATDLNEKTLTELNKEFPKIKVLTLDSTNNTAIKKFADSISKASSLASVLISFSILPLSFIEPFLQSSCALLLSAILCKGVPIK